MEGGEKFLPPVRHAVEAVEYPGDPPFALERLSRIEEGAAFALSKLSMSVHCGTHLDAPAHFLSGAATVDLLPLDGLLLRAVVIDAPSAPSVTPEALDGVDLRPGEAALFRTRNSTSGLSRRGVDWPDYVYLAPETAQRLADLPVALVGADYVSVDPPDSEDYPAHVALLRKGVPILEGLDLAQARAGRYTLVCAPLKLAGAEAAPARALLLQGAIDV